MKKDYYLRNLMEIYEQEYAKRNDSDYVIDDEQMRKFSDAYDYFVQMTASHGGKITDLQMKPKDVNGGLTVEFTLLHLYGNDLERFADTIRSMSALSIDATLDGKICISFTIPRVYKHK